MAKFPNPDNERKMKQNHSYKGNGRYNVSTNVPHSVNITPYERDRDRPYYINQGTGQYAKSIDDRNKIDTKNGCDRYKRTRYSIKPAECRWSGRFWTLRFRENVAKSYRDQARHKQHISRLNYDFLKKQDDDLSKFNNGLSKDNKQYEAESKRIDKYYYPQHKKIEARTEKKNTTAIKQRNAAENERDITYRILEDKRQTRLDKTNEYGNKTEIINDMVDARQEKKEQINTKIEDIDITQRNLLMEDGTLKDNWLLNYYYTLGNKRKTMTFGEYKKQNQTLSKKTKNILQKNTLYDRENLYLQEQNVYLLLFNRNGLILYYLLFLYFAYIFINYRQDTSLQTKLLYLVPLSIFPFLIAILFYAFYYLKLVLK
jgi:hypothetical protein